jgi:hypothetical protein
MDLSFSIFAAFLQPLCSFWLSCLCPICLHVFYHKIASCRLQCDGHSNVRTALGEAIGVILPMYAVITSYVIIFICQSTFSKKCASQRPLYPRDGQEWERRQYQPLSTEYFALLYCRHPSMARSFVVLAVPFTSDFHVCFYCFICECAGGL